MIQSKIRVWLTRFARLIRPIGALWRGFRRPVAGIERRASKGEIHLADLVLALDELPWQDESHARAIAGCLGFGLAAPDLQPSKPTTAIYDRRLPARKPPQPAARKQAALRAPPPPKVPVTLPPRVLQSTLTYLGQADAPVQDVPPWISNDYEMLRTSAEAPPPRQALFPANSARGVLSAALATVREGSDLNVDELIRRVVAGRTLSRLPRRTDATLSRGCHLLLDFADTMAPWWDDLHLLSAQVTAVVGEAVVSVFDFESAPGTASRWGSNDRREPWQPQSGTPVIVATDLGIRGRAASRHIAPPWPTFIERCKAADSPLVILVPWPREYWPEGAGQYPDLVHWNARTTASMVTRALGPGHGARR